MPYPALPPDLPHIVHVSSAEAVNCSSLADAAVPPNQATIASRAVRLAPPEALPLPRSAEAGMNVAASPPQSCAELLGTTAVGYLPAPQSTSPVSTTTATQPETPVPTTPLAAEPRSERSPAAPTATQTAAAAERSTRSPQLSYHISGVAGPAADTSQKTLMQSLNEAVMAAGLVESLGALSSLSPEELARLAKYRSTRLSQAPVPPLENTPIPSETLPLPPEVQPPPTQTPGIPTEIPNPNPLPSSTPLPINPANVVEVTADRQDYDERRQIFTAEGSVKMRVRGALLEADRVQVNLVNRLTVAEGNVAYTRGNQVLRGQRFDYNFVQGVGTVQAARGDIFLPSLGSDTAFSTETGGTDQTILARPLSDRVTSQQPLENVSSPGGIGFSAGAGRNVTRVPGVLPRGGRLRRLRFEAEQIDFTPEGWEAKNIQITNDPFSPPELVLKADRATLTRLSPLQDEVVATRPRLVFDQKVAVPILRRRFLLDRSEREPAFFRFGIDGEDRGGVFVEGILNVIQSRNVDFTIYPQLFLQRLIVGSESEGVGDLDNYGVRARLSAALSPTTFLRGRVDLNSLDFGEVDSNLRASVRLQQGIATRIGPHRLAFEYSFRDRLFNGSLGFQTVQSSLGALLISPDIVLGNTGLLVNYQAGYQVITSDTDRQDLLEPIRDDNRVTLGRFQATAGISRGFLLWQGRPLPPTRNEGLNYTANPVVPYVSFSAGLRGVFSSYTSGDTQQDLIGTLGIYGQFGRFSRKFFDYTAIGIYYSQVVGSGRSPFFFDRTVDNRVLTLSVFQQLYGPLRVGVQTSINLDTRDAFSTDYFLEYSRRTHGIIFRYNPVLEIGSIGFRISDFNWTGTAEPFEGTGITPVEGGVERRY